MSTKAKTLQLVHTHIHTHTDSFRGYLEWNKIEKENIRTYETYMLFNI